MNTHFLKQKYNMLIDKVDAVRPIHILLFIVGMVVVQGSTFGLAVWTLKSRLDDIALQVKHHNQTFEELMGKKKEGTNARPEVDPTR